MLRPIERRLRITASALVVLSHLALATTSEYPSGLLLLPLTALTFMPLGEWLDRQYESYRRLTFLVSFVYCVSLPFFFLLVDLLYAVVGLVMFIQFYSLVHEKRPRNYDHILLMSFFLVLAACVSSPSPAIGAVIALFVVATVWFLSTLEMYSSALASETTDTALLMDRQSQHIQIELTPRKVFDRQLTGWLALLSIGVVALTAGSFVAIPRMEAGILGTEEPETFQTGLSMELDITQGGTLQLDASAVMRVVFPERSRGEYEGPMYWRSTSLNHYTGRGWLRQPLTSRTSNPNRDQRFWQYSSAEARDDRPEGVYRPPFDLGEIVMQEIFLDRAPDGGVPTLSLVQAVKTSEEQRNLRLRWDDANDFTVLLTGKVDRGIHYTAWSEVLNVPPRDLRAASEDYLASMNGRDYRLLTNHDLRPDTLDLVERITSEATTVYDKIVAIERYLGGQNFEYSLEIPFLPEDHPIDTFIHETRKGHCELFASAMALMVRSLGVPARVVSGYRGGEYNRADESYTITADMAHLWVEVYFPDYGWITFDPSPRDPGPAPLSLSAIQRTLARYSLRTKMLWYSHVIGFDPRNRLRWIGTEGLHLFQATFRSEGEGPTGVSPWLRAALVAVMGLGMVSGVVLLVRGHAARRAIRGRGLTPDQGRAIRVYLRLVRRLGRLGIRWQGKTAEELRKELATAGLADTMPALQVLASYNAVRFGGRPLSTEAYRELRRSVRVIRPAK